MSAVHEEFFSIIEDLLSNEMVRRLDDCPQHYRYTRLRHSYNVAYWCYRAAKALGWDYASAARAGMLHDLFFLGEGQNSRSLVRSHPGIALENARRVCELNPIIEDSILRHMWLLTWRLPRYREGMLLTIIDKICASHEFVTSPFVRSKARLSLGGKLA